jgi:hypothetical protein
MYCTSCRTAFVWTDARILGSLTVPATRFGQNIKAIKLHYTGSEMVDDPAAAVGTESESGLPGLWSKMKDLFRARSD